MVEGGGWDFFGGCVLKKQSERETGACRAKGVGWVRGRGRGCCSWRRV